MLLSYAPSPRKKFLKLDVFKSANSNVILFNMTRLKGNSLVVAASSLEVLSLIYRTGKKERKKENSYSAKDNNKQGAIIRITPKYINYRKYKNYRSVYILRTIL